MKQSYTFVVITEKRNLKKLIKQKINFLNQLKINKKIYLKTRLVIINYSNIYLYDGFKTRITPIPKYLEQKRSLNLKKNFIINKYKYTYLHFIDDDTQICAKCYVNLYNFLQKKKLDFVKINRINVKKFTNFSSKHLQKPKVQNIKLFKRSRFAISNSSIQLIFYNKARINFKKDRGLGKINYKIGSENIFISENFKYSRNLRFQSIFLNCPIEHLSYSSGEKRDSLKLKIKSGHLKIIFKNLFKKSWVFFYTIYLLYLLIKKFFKIK